MSARIVSLAEGIAELVHDGATVAPEGFTHLIPVAAGHDVADVRAGTKCELAVSPELRVSEPPTNHELRVLRELVATSDGAR